MSTLFAMLVALFGFVALILAVVYVVVPLLGLTGRAFGRLGRFVGGEFSDAARFVGALVTAVVFLPLTLASVVIGRWSAAGHYLRASGDELASAGSCVYRFFIGRPLWLVGLSSVTEGIERRMPEVVARAPGSDRPRGRSGRFEGYAVVGSLPPGGSGARLYIAEPDDRKRAAYEALGRHGVGQVIIKSFSLHEGSSLPQIVRESRALEAAKNIGLVLEHELTNERFYYVMPYVPGDDLSTAIRRLHEQSGAGGLDPAPMRKGLGYARDLVRTLARYHHAGLWHKDVKPDNIIVHEGRAHLVDLGLVTPLRSAMTLTTHGTEYFRDPELVRMALRGVKVHQVSGEKFDVYAAGAVLYSIIENSFPAHGGLSQISRRCPESVRWIVRRAMAEYDKRYATADEMLEDLQAVLAADDPASVTPAQLPSMKRGDDFEPAPVVDELEDFTPAPRPEPAFAAAAASEERRGSPSPARPSPAIAVVNWWTGRYRALEPAGARPAAAGPARAPRPDVPTLPLERRDSAQEQLRRARQRVRARRSAAMRHRGARSRRHAEPNVVGRLVAGVAMVGAIMLAGGLAVRAMTDEAEPFAGTGASAATGTQLSHTGEDFQMQADARDGTLRITEPDGRTFEITIDPELIRDAAEEWPEVARHWRAVFMEEVVPALNEAQTAAAAASAVRPPIPPATPGASARRGGPAGAWLVVDQMGASATPEDRARIERKLGSSAFAGVRWLTSADEEGLELAARAIAAIGIGTPADPETIARLRAMVRETDGLTGLIWLYVDGSTRARAVASQTADERAMATALRSAG